MTPKKIPLRRCIGCMESKPKKELVRVVRSPEGIISIDLNGKKSGRGAYICSSISCLQKAQKGKRLERALECMVPCEVYDQLTQQIGGQNDE